MDATSAGKIGKYQIIRVLGRGGMGEVILAQDEDLGRRVAIKRPFKSAMEEGLARFQVEARAATLRHPNIPAVYEMGVEDGLPFIAMEFVEGEPLDKMIAAGRPTDLISKLSIIEQVCSALGHAHEKGIIHRDIKPANVIVQPDGVAKIIDFGIAKIQNLDQTSGLTQTSQIIGSLHYIAPERFKGEAIDGRADIFSAGVMLYLLLTGHLPFGGGEATASYKIVNEAHTSLGTHIHNYPPALDAIMDQALAKSPFDRYATAEDFADALHEVIEDLKKSRVFQLFDDAERLTTESRYAPALELLDEAIKLDPANTQVRKLRKFVREHQERLKRAERTREVIGQADQALAAGNFQDVINFLKDAQRLDPTLLELKERIQVVEEKKRRNEKSLSALSEAESVRGRGDVTGALRILDKALLEDAENVKLLAARGAIVRQAEAEAQQGKLFEIVENGRRELTALHFAEAEQLLREAEGIDSSHPRVDDLRRDLARAKEQEERRQLLEEIQKRVNDFLRADNYEQAVDLLNRAIDKLPAETMLHRLKMDVDAQARKFDAKRFVDGTISRARDLFATSPAEALSFIQNAIEEMPGEERLIACERSLRQQSDALRVEQLHADALRKAREMIDAKQFDKAIGILESFQVESGNQADVEHLLAFAREELVGRQRRSVVERCLAEARALLREERLEEAIRSLEAGIRATNDASLSRLLEETREQQVAAARKLELLQKRVGLLRERGEIDEAVQLLQEHLAAIPKSPAIQEALTSLLAEREQRQVTVQAIATAREAAQRGDFAAGLQALQTVAQAYGDSVELNQEAHRLQAERTGFAQEVVGKSIDAARAALLRNEPEAALAALKGSAEWVEYADAKRQADWQRIAKSAKDDLRRTPSQASTAALDQLTPDAPLPLRRNNTLVWVVVAGCVVLAAGGGFAWWKTQKIKPVNEAHIVITKAPPGALITVEGYPPVQADAKGEASIVVKPGEHKLVVSKDGFSPFPDDITVGAGDIYRDPAQLSQLPPPGKSGTLVVRGNVPKVKVFVDDVYKGMVSDGKGIPLEVGTHNVRYSAPGFVDSPKKPITIALNAEAADTFNLTALPQPLPTVGNLMIQTNPGAHVSIDGGQHPGVADANGNYAIDGLSPGNHSISAALDGYVSVQGKQVTIAAGQNVTSNAQLAAVTPTVVYFKADQTSIESGEYANLSWQVNNAASLSIDGIGTVASTGNQAVKLDQTTTYKLVANGNVNLQSLTVTVHPKPPPPTTPVGSSTPVKPVTTTLPDPDVLKIAVGTYKTVYVQASGKSTNECKSIFNGAYAGLLRGLVKWCETAKGFEAKETCSEAPAGTAEAPTMACNEQIAIVPKSGPKLASNSVRKNFHFSKNADGSWKVLKWD
jgi:eukaryotic-like serine/threonine-protein kinase